MCGVVGFFGSFDKRKALIEKVLDESSIRGLHSFGFSYLKGKEVKTFKSHKLIELLKVLNDAKPDKFIFHNRYSTSGDWKDHANNQPIHIKDVSLVFNGVISQAAKEENEKKYSLNLETHNDGEIFLKAKNKKDFVENNKGSFAGLFFSGLEAFCFRNRRRPLFCIKHKESLFFASTRDILERSGFEKHNLITVPSGEITNVRDI